ncbi:flavodoxin FldB [Teredinibacter sp. KSP-S5-2]|uniref:flavodoxin FldB n=1 Tax=Teredinibacter sp. KSP-S5-2 TaxID=3034506 RepID=UPI002935141F|nr:flavodoxin FldB [Teredinibacter sp. KSP-S5-2]WNO11587.1 flavodoxin FldB [Teredinibacter sp. KSP-S5-2]
MTHSSTKKFGLFYGSSTCYTEMAAEKIAEQLGKERVDLFNVADEPIAKALFYDCLIMGIPTWDYGELQEDWEDIWADISELDFHGKKIALFGLGDQVGYPEWFLDAMGYLHNKLQEQGATLIGYWPANGYQFEESKALTEDKQFFLGLALDEENEFDKTADRIQQWCQQIEQEFE